MRSLPIHVEKFEHLKLNARRLKVNSRVRREKQPNFAKET
ncbi:hypothetical protein C5167_030219, partial [Papaver somniferum]